MLNVQKEKKNKIQYSQYSNLKLPHYTVIPLLIFRAYFRNVLLSVRQATAM